ncbi:MAG TPA: biotin/lipoyl-containing protein [Polyangiaceae bacterium]|nr:biotin/lipoyl-containing protein [Polyangiaceae bacterium]
MKTLRITVDGRAYDVTVEELADDGAIGSIPAKVPVAAATPTRPAAPQVATAAPAPSSKPPSQWPTPASAAGKDVVSQVSGMIVEVNVAVGEKVAEGHRLVTIEAMKMNTYVLASFAGTVSEILAVKGKSVLAGDVLVRLS